MHHVLDRTASCNRWNRDFPPQITIEPGDTIQLGLKDSSDGQVHPGSTSADFAAIDRSRIHALTGPVHVSGAEPGDALDIEVISLEHEGWGWTSVIPGLGLLGDEFTETYLHIWKLEQTCTHSIPRVTLDLHPFCGIMGVQRAQRGEFRTREPGSFGGNMDVRQLGAGARLLLPVFTPGAGLCVGDAHAAQGDGEVSINGMEAPMTVTLRVRLLRGAGLVAPYAQACPETLPARYLTKPCHVFIESDQDAREASRAAVRRAMSYVQRRLGLPRELALVLCSVVLDLKISQIVNTPMTTISAVLPEAIFDTEDLRACVA